MYKKCLGSHGQSRCLSRFCLLHANFTFVSLSKSVVFSPIVKSSSSAVLMSFVCLSVVQSLRCQRHFLRHVHFQILSSVRPNSTVMSQGCQSVWASVNQLIQVLESKCRLSVVPIFVHSSGLVICLQLP